GRTAAHACNEDLPEPPRDHRFPGQRGRAGARSPPRVRGPGDGRDRGPHDGATGRRPGAPGSVAMAEHIVEGQTLRGSGRLIDYSNFVKLPHTLFALPFALVGATLASYRYPVRAVDLFWVVVAFTAARFAAMGFNRIADRVIDAKNPRTRMREIPSGKLTVRQATVSVAAASALFLLSAAMLNPLCLKLAPFALGWVLFYSYTKRFTRWAHLVLGFGMAIA